MGLPPVSGVDAVAALLRASVAALPRGNIVESLLEVVSTYIRSLVARRSLEWHLGMSALPGAQVDVDNTRLIFTE